MLREHVQAASALGSSLSGEQAAADIVRAFDASIDYVRDPQRLDDPVTNIVATSGYMLIGNQCVTVALIPDIDVSAISFTTLKERRTWRDFGAILLPFDFHRQTAEDPIQMLGAAVFSSEKARLFMQGYLHEPFGLTGKRRAEAAEAGAISAIIRQAENEHLDYALTPKHIAELAEYPDGFASLDLTDASGTIEAHCATHLKPTEPISAPETIAIGELDYAALSSRNLGVLSVAFLGLRKSGKLPDLATTEYYLRQSSSSLFLHTYPADHYGSQMAPVDPLTGERREFGLGFTRAGAGTTPPSLVLDELGQSYEENTERLTKAGLFVGR